MILGGHDEGVDVQDVQRLANAGVGVTRNGEAHVAWVEFGRFARPRRVHVRLERFPIDPPETNAPPELSGSPATRR